jgi:hypothetical protein
MTPSRVSEESLRMDRLEYSRLAWALGVSFVIHLFAYGGYEIGRQYELWQALHLPAWLQKVALLAVPKDAKQERLPEEAPLVYVDVSPQQATTEAPRNAQYYASRNSQAANPDADQDTGIPKINGTQTQVPKTEDTPDLPLDKLQPAVPSRPDPEQAAEQAKPELPMPPGDLAMAIPDAHLRPDPGTAEQSRPRTIKEALLRQSRNQRVGEKMKQDGGVRQRLQMTSLDAKGTLFGQYDEDLIEAVQSRWYDLLRNVSFDGYRRGLVRVEFHLYYDGRVTDMKVLDNSVGEMLGLLCQKAVLDPAPFEKWPREMRLMVDKDYRQLRFTFYYN